MCVNREATKTGMCAISKEGSNLPQISQSEVINLPIGNPSSWLLTPQMFCFKQNKKKGPKLRHHRVETRGKVVEKPPLREQWSG